MSMLSCANADGNPGKIKRHNFSKNVAKIMLVKSDEVVDAGGGLFH